MEDEVVIASSPTELGISCWDLRSGTEHLHYKSCASSPHGLTVVGGRFIASSQFQDPKAKFGQIFYWAWNKVQVEMKSFPTEQINPLVSNRPGTFIAGGGLSGHIFFWNVLTGKLLKKWNAHYRAVTCLTFSDDGSLLISGSEDGSVRVWNLIQIFDDIYCQEARHLYWHSFSEHTLPVTDVVAGIGRGNAIIVSASEDRTCKVWSIFSGRLLRNVVFPSIINAIALDPAERVFYAGSRDGKIYIAALTIQGNSNSNYHPHIIGSLAEHGKPVTSLAFSMDGILLVSGSDDGMVRVWDTKTRNIVRIFKHAKGPVNNILVVKQPQYFNLSASVNPQASSVRKHATLFAVPLEKYECSKEERDYVRSLPILQDTSHETKHFPYMSVQTLHNQIKELQQQGGSAAAELEMERIKHDCQRSMQMVLQWKQMYANLHQFCVNELLDGDHVESGNNGPSA